MNPANAAQSVEFHNTPGNEPAPHGNGLLLARYSRAAYGAFDSPGFLFAQESTGVEIRFVTPALHLRVFVSALDQDTEVAVFRGDFQHSLHPVKQGEMRCIQVAPPAHFSTVPVETLHGTFHPNVWRIVFNRGAMVFHGIDTFGQPVRPPAPAEKPAFRWLAYGSSITHSTRNGYVHQAARRLRVDVQNKGLSGSCYIEPEAVRFLSSDCDWDLVTLEMGINLRETTSPEEFDRRARHMVEQCLRAKPGRPIVLITVFPNSSDHLIAPDAAARKQEAFRECLRRIAREHEGRNVHLVEGSSLLEDFTFFSADLLHPSDYGQVRMGENLARILKPLVEAARK
jgi:lysophospholipase L1-like esterase